MSLVLTPSPPDVDVLVPTLRRPDSLARALRSLFAQADGAALIARVVVVDNSPERSARDAVEALRSQSPIPLRFVHAPKPGVATARNAGLAASDAPYVAFLDDDEEAPTHWISELRRVHGRLGADVTFGPVRGVAPTPRAWLRAYLDRFFSREGPARDGLIGKPFGCGNSIMTRASVLAGPTPFDVDADQSGGEDDRLFARLQTGGARFGWAADAFVLEHAPPHRATLGYALHRAFTYGKGPSFTCAQAGDWIGVAKWMAVGLAQTLVFGAPALALLAVRRPLGASLADRALRGLGKIFWTTEHRLYGEAEATRSTRRQGGPRSPASLRPSPL